MTPFNEARLLDDVMYGSQFGHEYNTRIVTLKSGRESRNGEWELPRGRYSVLYELLSPEDHAIVISTHRACQGALVGFRFKDWADFEADMEVIGDGDGTEQTFQLVKTYSFGTISAERIITKPVLGTVTIFADGNPIPGATIDYQTGEVIVDTPAGAEMSWSGEFDVPVRFLQDQISFQAAAGNNREVYLTSDVDLIEDRI